MTHKLYKHWVYIEVYFTIFRFCKKCVKACAHKTQSQIFVVFFQIFTMSSNIYSQTSGDVLHLSIHHSHYHIWAIRNESPDFLQRCGEPPCYSHFDEKWQSSVVLPVCVSVLNIYLVIRWLSSPQNRPTPAQGGKGLTGCLDGRSRTHYV